MCVLGLSSQLVDLLQLPGELGIEFFLMVVLVSERRMYLGE